jgi:Na+/citrate or Na+/malate symporter
LAGCVAASASTALIGSVTFDAFSFPVFMIVLPVVAGLCGATWNIARSQRTSGQLNAKEL